MARTRERVCAMRPIIEAMAQRTGAERQARNFAFIDGKVAHGEADEQDRAILRGRNMLGYDWDASVQYAKAGMRPMPDGPPAGQAAGTVAQGLRCAQRTTRVSPMAAATPRTCSMRRGAPSSPQPAPCRPAPHQRSPGLCRAHGQSLRTRSAPVPGIGGQSSSPRPTSTSSIAKAGTGVRPWKSCRSARAAWRRSLSWEQGGSQSVRTPPAHRLRRLPRLRPVP